MPRGLTRRELLKVGAAASVANGSSAVGTARTREPVVFSGEVYDVNGKPVPDAKVRIFREEKPNIKKTSYELGELAPVLGTGTTGGEERPGRFEVEVTNPTDRMAAIVTKGEWFAVRSNVTRSDANLGRQVLDYHLLYGPETAVGEKTINTVTGPETRTENYGVVTVWRRINDSDSNEQVFYIEVTNTELTPSPPPNESDYGHPWQIYPQTSADSIQNTIFSLIVPEDGVLVDYEGDDSVDVSLAGGIRTYWADAREKTENTEWYREAENALDDDDMERFHEIYDKHIPGDAQDWHPLRTGVPAFVPSSSYREFSVEESREEGGAIELLLDLAGFLPHGLGQAIGAVELVLGVVEDLMPEPEDKEVTVGDGIASLPSENETDKVGSAWDGAGSSVVFEVPLRFETGRTFDLIAKSVWKRNRFTDTPARVDFGHSFSAGASVHGPGVEPPERSDRVTVTGQIVKPDGTPAARNKLAIYPEGDAGTNGTITNLHTDSEGRFEYQVPRGRTHDIQYYQVYDATPDTAEWDIEGTAGPTDGSPDVFALAILDGADSRSLGQVQLPTAHVVDVTVIDEEGAPVDDARVSVYHYNDGADAGLEGYTDSDGTFAFEEGDDAGIELVGDVSIVVRPPEDSVRFADDRYERSLLVDGPDEVEFVLEGA